MNRESGKPAQPEVPTPERASEIRVFWRIVGLLQKEYGLEIRGDGIEIHDRRTNCWPAIVTESGELEILTDESIGESE